MNRAMYRIRTVYEEERRTHGVYDSMVRTAERTGKTLEEVARRLGLETLLLRRRGVAK